ncbi:serine hydrolase domain-containing protein [Streptomyces melanogenes]|uniref:serine hydrolase domain-containing protein n=1 Tax=Streptomyces melanogenes TaxID=67326 RepID=UPI00167D109D|nr:serine hydrolase domain-containing protein [Streptomyces melanogenes]
MVDSAVKPPVPGAILDVTGPRGHFNGASGRFASGGRGLRPTDTFRTASLTKTFTAAVVLKLVEQHELRLDDQIGKYLDTTLVSRVNVTGGVSYGSRITVRQLLNHTAGLYDYATDPRWQHEVLTHPHKTWAPRELVEWAITNGTPYFRPGAGYHYSDTGYVLAGLIVERVTGKPLAHAYRTLILDPLRMRDTYLERWEKARGGPLSHPYLGTVDTRSFNPTFDTFGGGGLVSTSADLTTFMRGLFGGRVFRHPATLRTMLDTTPQSGRTYGLGIQTTTGADGEKYWFHTGAWGRSRCTRRPTGSPSPAR